ncbi:F-box/LRR-repeat protein at3g03360 [Phtheirospermum japonicum]|uniref:F-box/LRR-repeat protein at3g03360 n=1 Tax=Phtheirospermum japonicum TaxID=374723 RepID=A0A830CZT2_9LAMI|nr:F-box/LRR-repeat protein at3g03360 [Phtheirospermum japonicum]
MTSVLSRRWRYLWTSVFSTLEFKDRDIATGKILTKRVKFKSWVNCVLKAYQAHPINLIDNLIIRFFNICPQLTPISTRTRCALDSWIHYAMQKESVQRFELDLSPCDSCYVFPNVDKLSSQIRCLRSLRLVSVSIKDEAVYHILVLCPLLEHLCINSSSRTRNLRVVDPLPNLKALEIIECCHIRSLEISCTNLVSLTFHGKKNVLKLLEIPNLRELNLGDDFGDSLIFEPNQHSSYSVQIEKLVLDLQTLRLDRATIAANPDWPRLCSLKRLELQVYSFVGRSLLFFTSLIKASPQLHEFRIQLIYIVECWCIKQTEIPYPAVSAAEAVKFDHKSLKVVEMGGYIGCSSERELLLQLFDIATSLERVVIDTESDYYDDPQLPTLLRLRERFESRGSSLETGATTRTESKERAHHMLSTLPPWEIDFVGWQNYQPFSWKQFIRENESEIESKSKSSTRWRYLWTSVFSTLEFKDRDIATGKILTKRVKFKSWVNCVLKAYQAHPINLIDNLIIRFFNICPQLTPISTRTRCALDSWIHYAMQKESVQRFELDLSPCDSCYVFPNVDKLSSQIRCLRSLRLVSVSIKDEAVYHILVLCPLLEHLCINSSSRTRNLRVVDPLPNLKALEIIECCHIRSLEISCTNLVSLTFHGKKNVLKLLEIPNLRELNLGDDFGDSLIFEPNQHSSYSVQIEKLVLDLQTLRLDRATIAANPDWPRLCSLKRLELQVYSFVGRSLLFFTSLIKASPQLHEFRIQLIYIVECWCIKQTEIPYPAVSAAEAVKFDHKSLKVVEMGGYIGCSSERELLLQLFDIATSLERVVIDTESDYYDDPQLATLLLLKERFGSRLEIGATTRNESKERAHHMRSTLPPREIDFVLM